MLRKNQPKSWGPCLLLLKPPPIFGIRTSLLESHTAQFFLGKSGILLKIPQKALLSKAPKKSMPDVPVNKNG